MAAVAAGLALTVVLGACGSVKGLLHQDVVAGQELGGLRERAACTLAGEFKRVDMVPSGRDGVGLRITHQEPAQAYRRLAKLWPNGPPRGIATVEVERPRPLLAIVLDDYGLHDHQLDDVWSIGQPLTYAILPAQRFSREYATWLSARGASVLAHLPMEPKNAAHMTIGGFLTAAMTPSRRVELLRAHLASLPGVIGWNNHMGSRLTEDPAIMASLVAATPPDSVVLDSRTTTETQLEVVARQAGRPVARRHLFIDNSREVASIQAQLGKALERARRLGFAVVIGHSYPETARALVAFVAAHGDEVQLVPIERVTEPKVVPRWLRACEPQKGKGHAFPRALPSDPKP